MLYDSIVTRKLDYEVELAVVIGKPGRHIPVERRARPRLRLHGRERHHRPRPPGRPPPEGGFEYALGPGKNFDTSAPLGPWIVTRDEIAGSAGLGLRTYRQRRGAAEQLDRQDDLEVAEIVAFFSHFYTLQPGVLIETGTPGGTAWATDPEIGGKPFERDDVIRKGYLQVGDVVRVEIEGIGSLSNPIVAAPAPQEGGTS